MFPESTWKALPASEREEKMKFLQGEKYFAANNNRSVCEIFDIDELTVQILFVQAQSLKWSKLTTDNSSVGAHGQVVKTAGFGV